MLAATSPVALKTRGGADATAWFPELAAALSNLPPGAHILDGEVTVLDEIGRSDFNRVHARALRRRWYPGADPVVLCAFDLLAHKGQAIRALPIEERKRRLRDLLAGVERSVSARRTHLDRGDIEGEDRVHLNLAWTHVHDGRDRGRPGRSTADATSAT